MTIRKLQLEIVIHQGKVVFYSSCPLRMTPGHFLLARTVLTYNRMRVNMPPSTATAASMAGKTVATMIRVHATIRENCKNGSMWRGRTVSSSSWSLEKRLRMRPVGVVSKKLMGLDMIWERMKKPAISS